MEKRKEPRFNHRQIPDLFRLFRIMHSQYEADNIIVNVLDLSKNGLKIFIPLPPTSFQPGTLLYLSTLNSEYQLCGEIRYIIKWYETALFAGLELTKDFSYALLGKKLDEYIQQIRL